MPKPKSKKELLESSREKFASLIELINSYPPEEREKSFTPGKLMQNIRDIVAHLHHWHLLMLNWYETGMRDEKPDMPCKGYTWQTLPDLNKRIWELYSKKDLGFVLQEFKKSYKKVLNIIESHSDPELFEKKKYHWTGSTSLGAYLTSCTHSHYEWAIKRIKKSIKE